MDDTKRERKLRSELATVLERQRELERERTRLWDELARLRVRMIRSGNDPGSLSRAELALSEGDRAFQERRESLARENFEHDRRAVAQGLMQGVTT